MHEHKQPLEYKSLKLYLVVGKNDFTDKIHYGLLYALDIDSILRTLKMCNVSPNKIYEVIEELYIDLFSIFKSISSFEKDSFLEIAENDENLVYSA